MYLLPIILLLSPGYFFCRTIDILMKLCNNIDDLIFFACLWDCILHSSQNRLPAMTFILSYMTKRRGCFTDEIVGSDVNLMVGFTQGLKPSKFVVIEKFLTKISKLLASSSENYNPAGHNILKPCNVLLQFRFASSKRYLISFIKKTAGTFCLTTIQSSLIIRQKDESQNGCFKKAKHAKISEKQTFLIS